MCELAVHWDGTFASDMPARFTLNINLLGAKTPGSVVLDIETGILLKHECVICVLD